jgi:hypothetical protein
VKTLIEPKNLLVQLARLIKHPTSYRIFGKPTRNLLFRIFEKPTRNLLFKIFETPTRKLPFQDLRKAQFFQVPQKNFV